MIIRALDPGVDEQQVEGLAGELLLQSVELFGAVHFQCLDLDPWHCRQCGCFCRIADRGHDIPPVVAQALHQSKPEAA
ncbi:hypothetical protein D3C78_1755000 [compost metagenome]